MARMNLLGGGIAVIVLGLLFGAAGLFLGTAADYVRGGLLFGAWTLLLAGIVMTGFAIGARKRETLL